MMPEYCSLCGRAWRPYVRYVRKGMATSLYAHRGSDGSLHTITHSQRTDEPDTVNPPRQTVSVAR